MKTQASYVWITWKGSLPQWNSDEDYSQDHARQGNLPQRTQNGKQRHLPAHALSEKDTGRVITKTTNG